MRAVPGNFCSINLNPNGIRAIINYDGADATAEPTSEPYNITSTECKDETGLVPIVPKNVGSLSYGEEMDLELVTENYVLFTLNGSSLFINWDDPTLLMVENVDPTYPGDYNVISLNGTSDTVFGLGKNMLMKSGRTLSFNP
jgi:hypothetical protein